MAKDLYVEGLDFQVYCGGRGNLFRLPNVKRDDGKFKVPLFPNELKHLTEADYHQLTSQPRALVGYEMRATETPVSSLLTMFHAAKSREEILSREIVRHPVQDTQLIQFSQDPPDCIRDLSEYKVKQEVNFNQAALQMGIFINKSNLAAHLRSSISGLMALKGSSTTYDTQASRLTHIKALVSYLSHHPEKQFSCAAMRSVISTKPCDGCPLYNSKEALLEQYHIEERLEGYYLIPDRGREKQLTNFLLTPKRVLVATAYDQKEENIGRKYTYIVVELQGEEISRVSLPEDAWGSRELFVKAFSGQKNLKVTATENDLQELKQYVLRDLENRADEQEIVHSVGVHRQIRNGKPRFTYVDRSFSLNKFQIKNTHVLRTRNNTDDVRESAQPEFHTVRRFETGLPRHLEAMQALLKVNEPEVVGPLFGWIMASHLKAHVFGLRTEYPLLGCWGGRGSGKTQTASLFCYLHGVNYMTSSPPLCGVLTDFAFLNTVSSFATVP
ncbi:MAG: hypothetical protein R3204_09300, partial [Oceanospirillum sp.]|nr:hypothetical protein [Oceanospirillum sp.]